MIFEAWGGPLCGRVIDTDGESSRVDAKRTMQRQGGDISGQYRPPMEGTEVLNADNVPLWMWYEVGE